MCGRFALGIPRKVLEEHTAPGLPEAYRERFNIAPSTLIPVWNASGWTMRTWGHVRKTGRSGPKAGVRRIINARSETMFDKPLFRLAASRRRCLIPAQAFYEWEAGPTGKIPHVYRMKDVPVFTMAGILLEDAAESDPAVVIATCPANTITAPVHDRMPVIIPPDKRPLWLDPDADMETVRRIPAPLAAELMRTYPVSTAVNSPSCEAPSCLEPAAPEPVQPSLFDF